jgi:hypothetical protein
MFLPSGQNRWSLFLHKLELIETNIHLYSSSKTEVGSAGEQPARDVLDGRQKCQFNGLSLR